MSADIGNGMQVYKMQPEQSGRQARRQGSQKQAEPAKTAGGGQKTAQPARSTSSSPSKPSPGGPPRSWADAAAGRTPSQQLSAAAPSEAAGRANGEGPSSTSHQLNGSAQHSSSRKRRSKSGNQTNKNQVAIQRCFCQGFLNLNYVAESCFMY